MTTLESLAKKLYEKGISINELIKVFDNYIKENLTKGNSVLKPKQSIENLANKMVFIPSCLSREIEKIEECAGLIDNVFLQLIYVRLKEEPPLYIAVGYKQYGDDYPTIIKPSEWIYLKINVKEDFASYGYIRYQRVRFRKFDIDELKQELEEIERAELYELISTKYREEVENLIREEIENLISDNNADNQETIEATSTRAIEPDIEVESDNTRDNQLHQLIWRVYQYLTTKDGKPPKAQNVWQELQHRHQDHDTDKIIQEIDATQISWCSCYGNEPKLQRSSFDSTLSKIKKKHKA